MKFKVILCALGFSAAGFTLGCAWKELLVSITVNEYNKGTDWAVKHIKDYGSIGRMLENRLS